MNLAQVEDHLVALVAKLRDDGVTVGEGWGKDNTGTDLSPPYVIVEQTSGPARRGPVGARYDDSRIEFYTKCVATSHRGASKLKDTVATSVLEGLSVSGRRVEIWSELDVGVRRDPDVHELFVGIDRWTLWTTPT